MGNEQTKYKPVNQRLSATGQSIQATETPKTEGPKHTVSATLQTAKQQISSAKQHISSAISTKTQPKLKTRINLSPILEFVAKTANEQEIIAMLSEFCLSNQQHKSFDQYSNPDQKVEYESFDQYIIIGPVMILYHQCILQGRKRVALWLMQNYYPLQVSYDNNTCYYHAIHHGRTDIAEAIIGHHSFIPTKNMLHMFLIDAAYEKGIYDGYTSHTDTTVTYTETKASKVAQFCTFIRHPHVHAQVSRNADILEKKLIEGDIEWIKTFLRSVTEENVYTLSMYETHGPIDIYEETDKLYEHIEAGDGPRPLIRLGKASRLTDDWSDEEMCEEPISSRMYTSFDDPGISSPPYAPIRRSACTEFKSEPVVEDSHDYPIEGDHDHDASGEAIDDKIWKELKENGIAKGLTSICVCVAKGEPIPQELAHADIDIVYKLIADGTYTETAKSFTVLSAYAAELMLQKHKDTVDAIELVYSSQPIPDNLVHIDLTCITKRMKRYLEHKPDAPLTRATKCMWLSDYNWFIASQKRRLESQQIRTTFELLIKGEELPVDQGTVDYELAREVFKAHSVQKGLEDEPDQDSVPEGWRYEKDRPSTYSAGHLQSKYEDAIRDRQFLLKHKDILEACEIHSSGECLPPHLAHIHLDALPFCIREPKPIRRIRIYEEITRLIKDIEKNQDVVDAYNLYIQGLELPPALSHIPLVMLQQIMTQVTDPKITSQLMGMFGPGDSFMDLASSRVVVDTLVIKCYQSLKGQFDHITKLMALLAEYYPYFSETGMMPSSCRQSHRETLMELCVVISTHPEPNKELLLTDASFIMEKVTEMGSQMRSYNTLRHESDDEMEVEQMYTSSSGTIEPMSVRRISSSMSRPSDVAVDYGKYREPKEEVMKPASVPESLHQIRSTFFELRRRKQG